MKFKRIIDLCKREETLFLYNTEDGTQWISDGGSMFPLYYAAELSIDSICQMFDITDAKRNKMYTAHYPTLPESFNCADVILGERVCEPFGIKIQYRGKPAAAYRTSTGVCFVDERYLAPFADEEKIMTELYERHTPSGMTYFAVKKGLVLRGIIMPLKINSEDFVKELELLSVLCRIEYDNRLNTDIGADNRISMAPSPSIPKEADEDD